MPQKLQIFRAGKHQSMSGEFIEFSGDDVRQLVDSYDPGKRQAPLVKGHPLTDDPAHGWVASLSLASGDIVEAEPKEVDPSFSDDVNAGRYRYISASLFKPDAPGNPVPGSYYLKHVGFLGAAAPAVAGLAPASFADAADPERGVLTFAMGVTPATRLQAEVTHGFLSRMRDWMLEQFGKETADEVIPRFELEMLQLSREAEPDGTPEDEPQPAFSTPDNGEGQAMPNHDRNDDQKTADFAAKEADLKARESALETRLAEFQKQADQTRRDGYAAFANDLKADGRISPAEVPKVIAVLDALHDAQPAEFAGAATESPEQLLRELLTEDRLEYGERFADDDPNPEDGPTGSVSFVAPRGAVVDPKVQRQHMAIEQHAREHDLSYWDAVDALVAAGKLTA